MKIELIVVGAPRAKHVKLGAEHYLKRLKPLAPVELRPVKAESMTASSRDETVRAAEADRILARLDRGAITVALDPGGREVSSDELTRMFDRWERSGKNRLAFVIGGPLGLDEKVIKRAESVLALSRLTFSHELSLLVALEAIYRALSIKAGLPYAK